MYIASQILVVVADVFYVVSMFAKNKKNLLLWLILSDLLFGLHYFLLKAFTGGCILLLDIVFLILTCIFNEKGNSKAIFVTGCVFAVAAIFVGIFTWTGAASLLPMIGMTISFVGFGINNLVVSKFSCCIRNLCNVIYMLILASYIGAAFELVLMISAITGSILNLKHKQATAALKNSNHIDGNIGNKKA